MFTTGRSGKYLSGLVFIYGIAFLFWNNRMILRLQIPNRIRIYSVYHKQTPIYQSDIVTPIEAGRALHTRGRGNTLKTQMIGDDTGDNISAMNDRYSELTALYWMWKNVHDADYVGLVHYRRYFMLDSKTTAGCRDILCTWGYTADNIRDMMKKYDIIAAENQWLNVGRGNYTHYVYHHYQEDIDAALNYIRRRYPQMQPAIDDWIEKNGYHPYNMFIMSKEIFDEYAAWLFDVLFAVDDTLKTDHTLTDTTRKWSEPVYIYQKRSPGFLAERLFDLWLYHHRRNYKIASAAVYKLKTDYEDIEAGKCIWLPHVCFRKKDDIYFKAYQTAKNMMPDTEGLSASFPTFKLLFEDKHKCYRNSQKTEDSQRGAYLRLLFDIHFFLAHKYGSTLEPNNSLLDVWRYYNRYENF